MQSMGPWTSGGRLAPAFLAGLLVAGLTASPAFAKKKTAEAASDSAKQEEKKDDEPFKKWDEVLKGAETKSGLFPIHVHQDERWIEIAPEQLDRPFLLVSSLTSGLGRGMLLGGMPVDTDLWSFHRAGNKIQVQVRNARFTATAGAPAEKAVALSYRDSVLAAAKIVSIHKESKHLLVDLDEIFIADLPGLSIALKQALGSAASFDKDRSAVASVKTFPKNLEIEVASSYTWSDPRGMETVSDPRYLPLGVHYSLSELPEGDTFRGRLADDRVGTFLTATKDFSRDAADTFFVRYVNRWKLEKQDPGAAVSPPKEPIVFYLDRTIPMEYRDAVRDGALMWNKAFEKAGFKDAIVVRDPPDDPDFDPEDARYNTIRWITSTEPAFGAIGPSRVDPRNGRILDADILVEAAMVQNVRRGYRSYVRTLQPMAGPSWKALEPSGATCSLAGGVELNAAVDAAAFAAFGEMDPGGTVPPEYISEFLHWVVAHEVGHTLGLRHNFRGSVATPYERLHDTAWTRENGLYDSVMEYPPANFALDRSRQGDYYTRTVGTYDTWAIRYAYAPVEGAKTPEDELPSLRAIAGEASRPGLEYGTDEDAFAGAEPLGVDPTVNQFDLGSDSLAYARDRLALIRAVRAKIRQNLIAPGESWERLRNTFDSLMLAQETNLSIVAKQVGGMVTSRSHRGDPGERAPFVPVPPARQREAMAILAADGFSDTAWEAPADLLNALQPTRWAHWGSGLQQALPLDYHWSRRVLDVQTGLVDHLLHPVLLSRILESETRSPKGQSWTLAEHLRTLTDSVFSELSGKASGGAWGISTTRRGLGRVLLARLTGILNDPQAGTPEDARSLARANLASLDRRIGSVLAARGAGMDEATKAYLDESRMRIQRALEARSVLVSGGRG